MITLSFVAFALVSIQWVLFGYSLAFGSDVGGFIGNLQYLGLNNVGMEPGSVTALRFPDCCTWYSSSFSLR